MLAARPYLWSNVPTVLGLALLAAAAADNHELMTWARETDWSLLVRADLELFSGLWLLYGRSPQRTRIVAIAATLGISTYDLARAAAGDLPRHEFGQVQVGTWSILGTDLIIVTALLLWRPLAGHAAAIDFRPARSVGTIALAVVFGVTVNYLQLGRFPLVVTAQSSRSPSSPGLVYLVYLPEGYHRSRTDWPLILYLHGAGDVGDEIARVQSGGLARRSELGPRLPFVIVAPQSPRPGWDVTELNAMLDDVLRRYRVDEDRVYLTGVSMGGYGSWALAAAHAERFAAIAPICGGGDLASVERLRSVPIWAFHGAEDRVVPPDESRKMAAALERAGGTVRLTLYPGVGHESGTMAYAEPKLYDWFLAHRRQTHRPQRSPARRSPPGSAPRP
jgi:poly(3-hydroxybutyrate) depolymerase